VVAELELGWDWEMFYDWAGVWVLVRCEIGSCVLLLDNYLTMPYRKPAQRLFRRQIWHRRDQVWHLVGERDYAVAESVFEFCHVWPALVEKRLQSRVRHP